MAWLLMALLPVAALAASSPWACPPGPASAARAWCNVSLALDARVAALLAALPPSDLPGMLTAQPYPTGGSAALGVPATSWWQEAQHGAATRCEGVGATFFPMPSHTAQAFNASLVAAIARAVGAEGRALGNAFGAGWGYWAPNVNPVRSPLWGRAQEVMGEDVTVCAAWAASYVRGLQEGDGSDPRYLQVAATVKHFAGYDFDGGRWSGQATSRSDFDARISQQDLADSYLPPFQAAVEAGSAGVMAAYTAINGIPSAASAALLQGRLQAWGFGGGHVVGDCGAVQQVGTCRGCHNFTSTNASKVAAVLGAGLSMDCGSGLAEWTAEALASGAVAPAAVAQAAARNLRVRFRLGAFDPPAQQPMAAWGAEHLCTPGAAALSLAAAQEGMVLLKNARGAGGLPLSAASTRSLALVGGNANDSMAQLCSYYAQPCGGFGAITTPLAAFAAALQQPGAVRYALGCSTGCGEANPPFAAAVAAAAGADATVLVAGLNCQLTGEGNDRDSLALPGRSGELIASVCAAAAPRPCILALATGSALDISAPLANENVTAIVSIGYAGPAGGRALAGAVLGTAPPPAGRLAATWYTASYTAEVSPLEMGMRPGPSAFPPYTNPGRTHRFYTGNATLLPFGFGLSYTSWAYTLLPPGRVSLAALTEKCSSSSSSSSSGTIVPSLRGAATTVFINVSNTGSVDSDDVVLAFVVPPGGGQGGRPLQELLGWARVHVAAGQSQVVQIDAPWAALTLVDEGGRRAAVPGTWVVRVGVRQAAAQGGMGFAEALLTVS